MWGDKIYRDTGLSQSYQRSTTTKLMHSCQRVEEKSDQNGNGWTNNYGRKINFSPLSIGELNHTVTTRTILISVENSKRGMILIGLRRVFTTEIRIVRELNGLPFCLQLVLEVAVLLMSTID